MATSTDATGNGTVATEAVVAKAAGSAFTADYAGTFPAAATSINLTGLGASATGLEAAVAINGTDYDAYADLTVDASGNATIAGLTAVTTSTKVKVRVKETATHLAGADKEITVTAAPDETVPTPGNSGTITTASVADTSLTLNWTKAADNVTTEANLKYYVYQSTANNIDTVENAASNGTLLNTGGTADIATYNVTGLTAETTYYFNVVVADEAENKAAYTSKEQATTAAL